ncbi:hypothetical protein Pmani_008342 [Petrolisthes manimaculis]|uniref:Uncharacterized protein n=1 Tax=Petrolisthes manimaculis TaxID=1843537 RepID=A0AAE1Q748_9EUCA|nr:hypothetical protein Pmani_008342 [Petrolisthes manimaculis]
MPHRHSLIARPKGLPGYAPGVWCAVCGKTAASTGTVSCVTPGCPNVCHHHCLSDTTQLSFTCEDVGALRNLLGIQDVVTYVPDTQDPIHSPPPSISDVETDLNQLEKTDLIDIIQKLRRENKKYKLTLGQFDATVKNIAAIRDSQVTVLNFIDYITATQINLNDITVTSTATSARGKTIDTDWTQHTAQHTESRDWWTSGKPRQLQRSSTDIITTSTKTDSPTTPSVPILPAPVITEETQTPPAPELALPGDSTSPAGPALSPRTSPPTPKPRNTTATISDNRSANPTPAYRKKPSPSTPARPSASGHRTRRDNPHHSSSQNTRTSGRSYYKTPVYQQSQPQRGRNNNRPDKTNSDPRPHPVPLLSLPTPWRTTTRQYCHHCKRTGHSDNNCYRQNWCDHCCREGHTIDSCRSLIAQERHEKLCNQLTEQTAATSRLVDFIKHLAQPSRPGYTETQYQPLHPTQLPYTARNYDYQPAYEEEADPYFC